MQISGYGETDDLIKTGMGEHGGTRNVKRALRGN
jgi:hypothetical protein